MLRANHPEALVFAIPNGGFRNKLTAARLKAEGVLAGASDLFVSEPRLGYHGLYVEMKRTRGGRVSPKQAKFGKRALARGYAAIVCAGGARSALATIEAYLAENEDLFERRSGGELPERLRRLLG